MILIDETLYKYSNDPIPQFKIDSANNAIENTNLLELVYQIRKETKVQE